MKYTKHFSVSIKERGVPHLNADQFQRYFNIVAIEGKIAEIHHWNITGRTVFKSLESKNNAIDKLTKKLPPEDLLKEMVRLSGNC